MNVSSQNMQLPEKVKVIHAKKTVSLNPDEHIYADNVAKNMVVIREKRRVFAEITLENYYQDVFRKEGIGITDIVMGALSAGLGLVALVVGVLTLNPLLIIGGGLGILSGGLGIAGGILRPVNPHLSNLFTKAAIVTGVASAVLSIAGAYRLGMLAARGTGQLANRGVLHSATVSGANNHVRSIQAASKFAATPGGNISKFGSGPAMISGAVMRAAAKATAEGVNAAYLTTVLVGGGMYLSHEAYMHGLRKQAETRYRKDQAYMNFGGARRF